MVILARPGGGWLSDLIGQWRRPVIIASFLLSVPIFALLVRPVGQTGFTVLYCRSDLASSWLLAYFIYVQKLVLANVTGMGLAVFTTFAVNGILVAPIVGGWLINGFSWHAAFMVNTVLNVMRAIAMLLVIESPETRYHDQRCLANRSTSSLTAGLNVSRT